MFWLTWRQHRVQVLITVVLLVTLGVFLALASLDLVNQVVLGWLPMWPLVVGLFWGAPVLAREYERGTHRLMWTQSVTRFRWLLTKLGGLGLAVTVAGLAQGVLFTLWLARLDEAPTDRFTDPTMFGSTGVAAGAWWLFAFVLGAATGAMFKRLLPAMAVTVAVFVLVMFGIFQFRSEYATPVRVVGDRPEQLMVHAMNGGSPAYLAPDGTEVSVPPQCANAGRATFMDCVAKSGYQSVSYIHPPDRYWRFQWTEAGILMLATGLLAGAAMYRVHRRPA